MTVFDYHERTKHHPDRYARSLGYLDWATQPDPFRKYDGAPVTTLDLFDPKPRDSSPWDLPYDDLWANPPAAASRPFDHAAISQLFYDSLAISAWKSFRGSRWALRVNPSSGNLHPTEGYLVSADGVFHYNVFEHALEQRAALSDSAWAALTTGLPSSCMFVGLTSIYWRESWKYGERGFRYCMHDAGHAIAALTIAAATLGWRATLLETVGDREVATLLGVQGQAGPEAEHPDGLLVLHPNTADIAVAKQRAYRLPAVEPGPWRGKPNQLSADHHDWPVIDEVSVASQRVDQPPDTFWQENPRTALPGIAAHRPVSAHQVIRQRRSAVAMDGKTTITRDELLLMLRRVMPDQCVSRALPWRPCVHLVLFVHRVEGVTPGVYLLVRDADQLGALQASCGRDFRWREEAPQLYLLHEADARSAARTISCHQDIAADGCFAVGMLARFEPAIREHGPWMYRRLFWETGVVGQVLYLEAEAASRPDRPIRATGIGCFFDDSLHQVLGLRDRSYQSLYHFTVGGPVDDERLTTEPAYAHRP